MSARPKPLNPVMWLSYLPLGRPSRTLTFAVVLTAQSQA